MNSNCRGFHGKDSNYYNVVIDTGTRIMKGFSVVSIGDFLSQLRPLVDNEKFISDILPSCSDRIIQKSSQSSQRNEETKTPL